MKDPRRLLEHGASETELALLRAGAAEEPSGAARQRLIATLGVSGALGGAALVPSAAAQGGVQGAAGAGAGAGGGAGGGALKLAAAKLGVKGLALALGSASAVGGVWLATQLPDRPEARAPIHQAVSAPQPGPRIDAARASLAGEIAQLDRARGLLRAGDARAAARALDQYAREQPRGALRQEADVLRIEVHWQLGELAQARRLSRAFLRAHAASPHAARVRARLDASAGPER